MVGQSSKQADLKKKLNLKEIRKLEKLFPDSVHLDEKNRVVILNGWTLSEKFPDSIGHEKEGENIEKDSNGLRAPGISRNCGFNTPISIVAEHFLVGMVNPLTNAPEKNAQRNESSRNRRVGRKKTSPINQKNESSSNDQNLVPVIKGQLRKRVIHFFRRFMT